LLAFIIQRNLIINNKYCNPKVPPKDLTIIYSGFTLMLTRRCVNYTPISDTITIKYKTIYYTDDTMSVFINKIKLLQLQLFLYSRVPT